MTWEERNTRNVDIAPFFVMANELLRSNRTAEVGSSILPCSTNRCHRGPADHSLTNFTAYFSAGKRRAVE